MQMVHTKVALLGQHGVVEGSQLVTPQHTMFSLTGSGKCDTILL